MNSSTIILGAAALGLIVNTLAVLGVAWKGGRLVGHMELSVNQLTEEVRLLRTSRDEHDRLLTRVVQQLDDIEHRVERLEGRA